MTMSLNFTNLEGMAISQIFMDKVEKMQNSWRKDEIVALQFNKVSIKCFFLFLVLKILCMKGLLI